MALARIVRLAGLLLLCLALAGCANWNEDAGVDNHWRADTTPQWQAGVSTADDVMAALGPPSQIVNLGDRVVYYYLRENISGSGYYFLIYNNTSSRTTYDRAIFFFDTEGRLQRHAYSREGLPYDD
jgi:outer membrane protein assembly factor BamE (lipoprotein component of BamABCDE complex)